MSELRQDWFIDRDCKVWQDPDHFCFNTDTVLLAKFMEIRCNDTVIDIGTNNGALLMYADRFGPKKMVGIEIQPEAAKIARLNLENAKSASEVICAPVQTVEKLRANVVISNPPFFTEKASCVDAKDDLRQAGRIEKNLKLDELIEAADRLLEDKGRFYMVHRPDRIQEILYELKRHGFGLKRMQVVYDRRTHTAKSLLVEAVKNGGGFCTIMEPGEIG